jgi:hypothetical protein
MINERFMEEICDAWGFKLLYEIVEHLEQGINPKYARKKFTTLLWRWGGDDRGKLQKARPKKRIVVAYRKNNAFTVDNLI